MADRKQLHDHRTLTQHASSNFKPVFDHKMIVTETVVDYISRELRAS